MERGDFAYTACRMILLYVLFSVYIAAINFYSFLLIKSQRASGMDGEETPAAPERRRVGDGKLLLAAFLGGAVTMYVSMFVFRYRLNDLLLMIALPVLAALNIYLFILAYRSGFGFAVV